MKIKDEKGVIQVAKFVKEDEVVNLDINGEKYCSHHFLMDDYEIVDIDRSELKMYNEFLNDVRFVLYETAEFFAGKMEAWHEQHEEEEEEGKDMGGKD